MKKILISNYEKFNEKIKNEFNVIKFKDFDLEFDNLKKISYLDIETNGLDCHTNMPLLYGFEFCYKNKEEYIKIIIHHNYCDDLDIKNFLNKIKNFRVAGHNIKFDIKFFYAKENILFENVYDTMIAEQRLYQKSGIRFGYKDLVYRYLKKIINKDERVSFIGQNYKKFIPTYNQLVYLINDIEHLKNIIKIQYKEIYEKDQNFLINKIENPLVSIIAKTEADGCNFNLKKWKELAEIAKEKRFKTEKEIDNILINLRDELYKEGKISKINYLRLKDPKLNKNRKQSDLYNYFDDTGKPLQKDLFGNKLTKKQFTGTKKQVNFYENSFNYGSDALVVELFGMFEQPCPTKDGEQEIPQFNEKHKIDKSIYSFTTKGENLLNYLIENPSSIFTGFIKKLLIHRKQNTLINNFGYKYEHKINPVTNKIHSIFRQARADTGRLQSGGGKKEPDKINFQNIPGIVEYRNCFNTTKDRVILTSDYSGAELVIMCSLSQDMNLYNISKQDMHSYIATKCFKEIYKYRYENYQNLLKEGSSIYSTQEIEKEINKNKYLYETFIIDKSTKEKELMRKKFKPVTFGVIYGLTYRNLSNNLKISEEEAKIVIKTIENTFPKVFKMVKNASKFAMRNGYLKICERTNSIAYFPTIIAYLKKEISFEQYSSMIYKEANEARNIKIQGTQADFMKEAIVNLYNVWKKHDIDAKFITWVHDEIVDDVHKKELDRTFNIKGKTFNGYKELKNYIMIETANKYLNKVKIGVETDVKPFWTK